jgi:polar amino acid transport system substrate-binding protein
VFSVKKKFQRSSRRASIVVTSLLVLSALSACSKSDSDMSTLEKVQKQGFATYGLEAQYEPFGFRDESNNIVGYDIDLGNAIGEELGIEMRPVDTGWATVIQTMIDGGFDFILGGMTATAERAERVDFGVTYAEQASAFLVRADDTLKEQGELGGRKVAAGEGTPSVKMLEDNATQYGITYDGEIQQFGDDATAYEALAIGRIDAYATSYVSLVPLMKKRPGEFKAVMFRPDGWPDFYACMAFRQDDDTLRNAIDEAILKLKKDGTLAKLQIKWFGVEMKTLDTAPEL